MYNTDFNRNENFWNGLHICQNQSSSCEKCERAHRFEQLLNHLTLASKAENYEERISTTVVAICADEKLMAPLQLILPREFDERKHIVDSMAQKCLQQASKSVQHLVPIKSVADGNCLFNSIISLLPDSNLSAVELRVRTVIELVKNKIYYANQCSNHVGPFEEALRRTCNNNTFSELYEIVALANVLQCEVQSVYPYIDYRAEMKIMNQMYKSAETLVPNSRRVIIFWSSTEDEISTRTRPGNHGIWNPNHFVPLLEQYRSYRTEDNERVSTTPESPRKATSKNSPASFIQSLEFSPPPNTTKHKDSAETYFETIPVSQATSNRSSESEGQRNARLTEQRKRSALNRLSENEDQRNARLTEQRKRSASNRSSESEDQRNARLTEQRKRSISNRLSHSQQRKTARLTCRQQHLKEIESVGRKQLMMKQTQIMSIQGQRRVLERKKQALIDQYHWPAAIPMQLKECCLQDFSDHMSMSVLRQSICIICNIRASANTMKEYALQNIPHSVKLSCHADLIDIIPKSQQTAQNENTSSIFFSLLNAVFYKKGYNTLAKTGNICQECNRALAKDQVPIFSAANKMWIGGMPLVLQQLTIAEEKLISLYRHNSCVIKLHSPFHHHSTAQTALKGNVITFMHNMSNIVTSLPLDVEDLCDTLKIVFVGADIPNRVELLNEINIAKLPEDDVPESIWTIIERIENAADGDVERAGYTGDPLVDAVTQGEAHTTNIFPITTSAILDVNGTTIASKDIGVHLLHKIKNSSSKALIDPSDISTDNMENEDVYVIPRSNMPVNDCANPEFLLGLFPTLFPYGCGAPYDSTRPSPVSLNQHIRYLLAYEDQRFEKHHSFMTVGGNVMGSAYSRASLRTQIHALIFNQGLPSIFMTINPADIHSRVALYFAGVDLDLDTILPEKIPSTYERAQIIASHPVATARFFNVLISSILKCMVEKGVLGPIKAYFGTVENQGRGSLHLHILMWLDHDLTPSQLKESVKNEEFRNGLLGYLEDIIKQDLSNFDFDTSETDVPERQHTHIISNNECAISTTESNTSKLIPLIMPTPKPSMPNFALHFKNDIVQLVNSNNIHKHTITCYKYSKKYENPTCRMRMPRRIENVSSINIESGEIKLKRLHETINNFNEYIISACRSNMDIKYIFSGSDAKALVYYITDYVTKSNLSFHDTFSLVLKAIQSLEKQKLNIDAAVNAEEKSRRLVLRCYNTLASQQELSGVQVASYLMGWPDHYTTHEFVNLFLILGLRIIYRQH
ncbi:unnamed protein product [Rotaria socialis]|uniref:ATP-dependent DNA helicase n=1 Tax=Rotaria socialis TaxID=392032 RepID=A0A821TNW6_9BILA|nr:unnamed protein product [Rotaria socialis]CAF4879623.1 unnamed protein product [Rotaria socialis]